MLLYRIIGLDSAYKDASYKSERSIREMLEPSKTLKILLRDGYELVTEIDISNLSLRAPRAVSHCEEPSSMVACGLDQ